MAATPVDTSGLDNYFVEPFSPDALLARAVKITPTGPTGGATTVQAASLPTEDDSHELDRFPAEDAGLADRRAVTSPAPRTGPAVLVFEAVTIDVMMLLSGILLGRSFQLGQENQATATPVLAGVPVTNGTDPAVETPVLASHSLIPVALPAENYSVQVAALRARSAAADLAEHLSANGWLAYVQDFHQDLSTTPVYRVRVGRFTDRDEAERARQRLKTEEQLAGWVARP